MKQTIDCSSRDTLYLQVASVDTQQTMKTRISNLSPILILAACSIIFLAGCATMQTENTPSLLSQAGFHAHTPQTAKQKELYAALPSNKLEHATVKGKGFYVFKDEKAGVAYIGGESAHRRYQQLCTQQHVTQAPEEEMSHPFGRGWSSQWGPAIEP
jgi:hypothetical protein